MRTNVYRPKLPVNQRNAGKITTRPRPSDYAGLMTCETCGAKVWFCWNSWGPGYTRCEFCVPEGEPAMLSIADELNRLNEERKQQARRNRQARRKQQARRKRT